MGGQNSKVGATIKETKDINEFIQHLDAIATQYIQSQNFKDMVELQDAKKNGQILLLTKEIIEKELEHHKIDFSNSVETNMVKEIKHVTQDLHVVTKDQLHNLQLDKDQRVKMAQALAMKYIKIASIFSAIYVVVNPEYENQLCSESESGPKVCKPMSESMKKKKEHIKQLQQINPGVKINSFCAKRLNMLLSGESIDPSQNGDFTVKPGFCKYGLGLGKDNAKTVLSLDDEPGIIEIDNLYNDVYDFTTRSFNKKSKKMQKQYQEDLAAFYTAMKGISLEDKNKQIRAKNKKLGPEQQIPEIKLNSFRDIKLEPYTETNSDRCFDTSVDISPDSDIIDINAIKQSDMGAYKSTYKGKTKPFSDYASHIRQMQESAEKRYTVLFNVINTIFVNKNGETTINTMLSNEDIDEYMKTTRDNIRDIYIHCEEDFKKGVKLFENILAEKMQMRERSIQEAISQSFNQTVHIQ